MGMMNKQLNMPALQKIMREFERQNERMEMTSEMMGDAIDDAFEAINPPPLPPVFLGLWGVRLKSVCVTSNDGGHN